MRHVRKNLNTQTATNRQLNTLATLGNHLTSEEDMAKSIKKADKPETSPLLMSDFRTDFDSIYTISSLIGITYESQFHGAPTSSASSVRLHTPSSKGCWQSTWSSQLGAID